MHILVLILAGLKFVLRYSFSYPNLKLSNIMVTEAWDIKLSDQSWKSFRLLMGQEEPHNQTQLIRDFGLLAWELITELPGSYIDPQILSGYRKDLRL